MFTLTDTDKDMLTGKICPYCKGQPILVSSVEIYGTDYGMLWECKPCKAYVGCHRDTTVPKGRLANAALRSKKKQAHEYFDRIWKSGLMDRSAAYKWLSEILGTPPEFTHIGMFNENTCKEVIKYSIEIMHRPIVEKSVQNITSTD